MSPLQFNLERDVEYAHADPRFEKVLHIFDANWHGIRSASGATPGHKLAIDHRKSLEELDYRYLYGLIYNYGIDRVIFQGYSQVASSVCMALKREFGNKIQCHVITHVTTAQFEHYFEIEMLKLIRSQIDSGYIDRHGSVKPDFSKFLKWVWPGTIYNYFPNVPDVALPRSSGRIPDFAGHRTVFVSLENTFRKNLYTNIVAAAMSELVERIYSVNEPSGLAELVPYHKLRVIGFQNRAAMFKILERCDLALNVTFAECQPMTQLEAVAVGTPCLTGDLQLEELADLELTKLLTVSACDNPRVLAERIDRVLTMRRDETDRLQNAIHEHKERLLQLASSRYLSFLYE